MLNIYCRNTHNAVKQTAALCLLKMLRVNPKAIPIDQHAAKIVQLINDKHLVSTCSIYNYKLLCARVRVEYGEFVLSCLRRPYMKESENNSERLTILHNECNVAGFGLNVEHFHYSAFTYITS